MFCKYSTTPRSRSEGKGLFLNTPCSEHWRRVALTTAQLWGWRFCSEMFQNTSSPWHCGDIPGVALDICLQIPERKAGLLECFPHSPHCSVSGLDQEPLTPIPVGHKEEVVGWHRCARPVVSLQECAEGVTGPSQEICVWLSAQGWPVHWFTWMLNSPPVLPFAAPGTSSAPCCQNWGWPTKLSVSTATDNDPPIFNSPKFMWYG